jgi:hypothetical protein
MINKHPKIISLKPIVLADNRRVILEMVVEGLANPAPNNMLLMPDLPGEPTATPPKPDPDAPSPYPNVELSILNSRRQQVTSLFIVEHKESHTDLTLHLSQPKPQEQYTARAEMSYNEETIDVLEVPFRVNQVN